ncbi:hypothetical protein M758_12G076900 [Ceratodon purpureus]|nr:hypothetical protein M758_12G076900 [Ceratodon purpureus]
MLLLQLPELPQNKFGLANMLHGKLLVTKETYKNVAAEMPELVASFLLEADDSRLPMVVGAFLLDQPEPIVTEIQTTLLVAGNMNSVFRLLKHYARLFKLTLSFNSTEKARNIFSQTTAPRKRPDTIGIASGCTLLVGDNKLEFILGYIAAGTKFQWVYIGKNDMSDRCNFLLSVGYGFPMEESPDGKRKIQYYDDKVVKSIRDFSSYCVDQGTDITVINKADVAARTCRLLLQIAAHGSYRVEFGPLGYQCILVSEEDCRWMAQCVCQALCTLHSAGLVHRDVRLPNIVRLPDTKFMLIDLEYVADSPFILFDGFKPSSGWYPEMYVGNQYTPFSDMYSIGKLLDAHLPGARTAHAEDFIRKLPDKQLSSSQPLQHPWLSELMQKVSPNPSLIL